MSEANQSLEEFLFEAALEKSSIAERAAFLNGVCRDNPALRARIDALLEAHFQAEGFLTAGPKKVGKTFATPPAENQAASVFIGRYKLLEKIGEGGFGDVWMAEQKEPVRRTVALKIIKLGMDTKQVVARFEAERQALAMMDHPNIARVFDGGATESGRPYFVMELVRGVRITDYCDQNQLTTHERLKLFIQVCLAIQHAHQKGIIHRDVKPSNILVTLNDGVPVPKVIDFGIAKATQLELTEKTVFTQFHQFLGTPAYVSPEQASMSSVDVDTRSDIYGLGVLLYELLTRTTPFDTQELLRAGLDGMRQIICERPPLRPSARLNRSLSAAPTDGSAQSKIKNQKSKIADDLDWIVMKCLEKDRARRYETANDLAADLKRHLNTEPVIARPPSIGYKLQKAIRRNRLTIAAMAAIFILLITDIMFAPWRHMLVEMEFLPQDWQARIGAKTPVDNRLVLIGIDGKSVSSHFSDEELQREPVLKDLQTPWPWSRAVHARLLEKLSAAGARVIVFDFVFASHSNGDDAFHQALDKYKDRVVIGYLMNQNMRGEDWKLFMPGSSILTSTGKVSELNDDRLGYVNLWPDSDDTVRRASCRQTGAQMSSVIPKGAVLESLEARALRKFGRPDLVPTGFDTRVFRYTGPANQAYKAEPVGDVLSPKLWEKNYDNGKFFKDKIVIIGPTAEIFHDIHNTPFTNPKPMSGPEIHLQIINAALHGQFLGEPPPLAGLAIIAMFGVIAVALRFLIRPPGRRLLIAAGLSVGYVVLAQLLFDHAGLVIPLVFPLLALVVCSFIILACNLVMKRPWRMN